MRRFHLFAICAIVLSSGCGFIAEYPDFSAKQYRLEGQRTLPGGEVSGPAVFYRDGEYLRYDGLVENRGVVTVIYDPAREGAFLLQSASSSRRAYAGAPPQPLATRLSPGETPQPLETAWEVLGGEAAHGIGRCRAAGERGTLWRPRDQVAPDIERSACITADGIVLRLTENDVTLFEATAFERGPQPRSMFTIPETYRIIDAEFARAEDQPGG